ncbi:hypothetical protein WSS15_16140 [Acetobacter pasteurianus]|uniref:Uncharacterized protein n=1 Tax=Acetobacter pasteurianus TaxID=438 RepID=A0A1A0DM17_ACEPA|nr:hypothetical protein [Acetobacter pasteurianus]OAZ75921.1 hypothetical protein SRCM100623_00312 [Acetobacter pasteurianus]GLH28964.1 hypothetical protein WSS15_16140 [Acetobacter pasteurianus]
MTQPANTAVSRRTALASAFAASAAAVLPAVACAATSVGNDAHLLALYQQFQRVSDAIHAIDTGVVYKCGTLEATQQESKLETLLRRDDLLLKQIANTPALTSRGRQIKASIVLARLPRAVEDFNLDLSSEEIQMCLSLARDVAGGAA